MLKQERESWSSFSPKTC